MSLVVPLVVHFRSGGRGAYVFLQGAGELPRRILAAGTYGYLCVLGVLLAVR